MKRIACLVDGAVDCPSSTTRRRRRRLRNRSGRRGVIQRTRTSFGEDQLSVLEAQLTVNASPDSADVDRLSTRLGLSRRVVQVWFQNARARLRKRRQQHQADHAGECSSLELFPAFYLDDDDDDDAKNSSGN